MWFREGIDSEASRGNITNQSLLQLSALIDELTRDKEGTTKCMDILLGNSAIQNCIHEYLMSKITHLRCTVTNLENRIDGIEQYSRCTCLKFSGIPEGKGEKTDDIIFNITNQFIFSSESQPMEIHNICRSHRVGLLRDNKTPREIILRFVSCRDKTRVFGNTKNLKNFNLNPSNRYKIFVNEALTKKRTQLYYETIKHV